MDLKLFQILRGQSTGLKFVKNNRVYKGADYDKSVERDGFGEKSSFAHFGGTGYI